MAAGIILVPGNAANGGPAVSISQVKALLSSGGYITQNQTITLSGDISGSGRTSIPTTLPTVNSDVGTFQGITVNGKGQVTAAANQGYLTGNQTITLSGYASGSGATSIAVTVGKVQGVTDGSDAAAGDVGEYLSSKIGVLSAVSLTTTVSANVTSLSLTAGDWDVGGVVVYAISATATLTESAINNVSATLGGAALTTYTGANGASGQGISGPVTTQRFSLTTTTTIYLVANATFASGTCGAYGFLWARRAR